MADARFRGMPARKTKPEEPWEKPAPKGSRHTKLSGKSKRGAHTSAKKAGRKYPSLVDNMNAAKKQRAGSAGTRKNSSNRRKKS
jgi:hypothetical protein